MIQIADHLFDAGVWIEDHSIRLRFVCAASSCGAIDATFTTDQAGSRI